MLTKRIIPCLDIQNGRTVKGTNFLDLRDAGDPVELGARYAAEGADELVFLDITATIEKRKTLSELARRIAQHINIPFTVGGGISSVEDVSILLDNGADKISVNTAAFKNPPLITELARAFGSQCVVLAIDAKKEADGEYYVYLNGGRMVTETLCLDWAKQGVERPDFAVTSSKRIGAAWFDGGTCASSAEVIRRNTKIRLINLMPS